MPGVLLHSNKRYAPFRSGGREWLTGMTLYSWVNDNTIAPKTLVFGTFLVDSISNQLQTPSLISALTGCICSHLGSSTSPGVPSSNAGSAFCPPSLALFPPFRVAFALPGVSLLGLFGGLYCFRPWMCVGGVWPPAHRCGISLRRFLSNPVPVHARRTFAQKQKVRLFSGLRETVVNMDDMFLV